MKNTRVHTVKEESLFIKLLSKLVAYWPLFSICSILFVSIGYAYLRYAIPKYQASASLIIKDEKKGNEDSKLMESLNLMNTKKIIENETEVLQSIPIITEVVKRLHLYAQVYREGKVISRAAYHEAPLSIEAYYPDSLQTLKEKIYFRFDAASNLVYLNSKIVASAYKWVQTPYGILRFIPNASYHPFDEEKPFYYVLTNLDDAVKNVQDNLKVTATNKLSSVINLQYRDGTPRLAEDVLNEIIFSYNNLSAREKNKLARNTLAFIDARLNVVRESLDSIENEIRKYKGSRDAVDISTQGQLYLQNVSTNDQKLSDLDMQLTVINELEKQISDHHNDVGIMPASLGIVDPTLSQLVSNLNTSEQELQKLKKTVAENNPILISVNDQISNTKAKIIENIGTYRKSLLASKQNLFASNKTYNRMLQDIPSKEQALLEISRDSKIKSDIYSFLLQKREESELSYISNFSDTQVVNFAHASVNPVSPNRLLVMGSVLIAIIGIPLGFIGFRETFARSVLYRDDIEDLTSIPIIGEVGYNKIKKQRLLYSGERTPLLDEFRRLRYSLLSRGIGSEYRKLLVSSSISGEGKSYIAANLAASFSLAGKKVILIDFDLHNSSLKGLLGTVDEPGVSDYLNHEAKISDIIQLVPGFENLYFIAAGTRYNDPSALIENEKVQELIHLLEFDFDLIILDSPPVVQVTDAYVLSKLCDTTLYVIKHGYSPKRLIKILDVNNETNPLKEPAIIFNGVKPHGYLGNNYGYGYGYNVAYTAKGKGRK